MKKNIIWLIVLSLAYIPVILFDLFSFGFNICYPCDCWDIICQIKYQGYGVLIGYILVLLFIFLLNLLFLIPIVTFVKNIKHELRKKK